jgi:hypothetical protein
MSTSDVPVILLLLLPGFLAIQAHNWVSHKRRMSDLETILWAVLASFALLIPTSLIWHEFDQQMPSPGVLIKDPKTLPVRMAAIVYALALPLGWVSGNVDRSRFVESLLLLVRVDLKRRHDVWFLVFRDAYYVIVYLKSGTILYGWPEMNTTNRDGSAAELYITNAGRWDSENQEWDWLERTDGVWVDAGSIDRIEFTKHVSVATASET